MKRQTKMVEGPEAWKRFEGVMKNVLAVPHSEIQKRIKRLLVFKISERDSSQQNF